MNKLNLNEEQIKSCRVYASRIADDVQSFIDQHTTLSVERTVLRLLGVDGVDDFSVPLPNKMVDDVVQNGDISKGISVFIASALKATGLTMNEFIDIYLKDKISLCDFDLIEDKFEAFQVLKPYYEKSLNKIKINREKRDDFLKRFPRDKTDLYVIVATGNIDEDVIQAVSAAKAGADIIAVIRSTGQSLLDYVPSGKTTEGFGGTFAIQENSE